MARPAASRRRTTLGTIPDLLVDKMFVNRTVMI